MICVATSWVWWSTASHRRLSSSARAFADATHRSISSPSRTSRWSTRWLTAASSLPRASRSLPTRSRKEPACASRAARSSAMRPSKSSSRPSTPARSCTRALTESPTAASRQPRRCASLASSSGTRASSVSLERAARCVSSSMEHLCASSPMRRSTYVRRSCADLCCASRDCRSATKSSRMDMSLDSRRAASSSIWLRSSSSLPWTDASSLECLSVKPLSSLSKRSVTSLISAWRAETAATAPASLELLQSASLRACSRQATRPPIDAMPSFVASFSLTRPATLVLRPLTAAASASRAARASQMRLCACSSLSLVAANSPA
mmetsp:Transcript_69454/g.224649  ORF Transcript_69454/g.224649 Transcript_69454/m.224649 type:complete len:321 (-) Transcript_69454:1355-2317(-)